MSVIWKCSRLGERDRIADGVSIGEATGIRFGRYIRAWDFGRGVYILLSCMSLTGRRVAELWKLKFCNSFLIYRKLSVSL